MKKIIITTLTLFALANAINAQCGLNINLFATGNGCLTKDTLKVRGASNAFKIEWYYNSSLVATKNLVTNVNSTTVAGGNLTQSMYLSVWDIFIANGEMYVANGSDRILKFPAGTILPSPGAGVVVAGGNGPGSGANMLNQPKSVFVDGSGNIYVSDVANNRIQKFPPGSTTTTNGVTVAGGNGAGNAANQLKLFQYSSVFVDANGNIYVADEGNHRIQWFPAGSTSATNGVTIAGGNGQGSAANQFWYPTDVFVDVNGNIYVVDNSNNRIQWFPSGSTSATNGVTVAGGNGQGSAANQFYSPVGVYVDVSGNIYVTDDMNSRIQKFPPGSTSATNGVTVGGGNGQGSSAKQLNRPKGIFAAASGNVFVADQYNGRIQKFLAGSTSATNGITLAGGLGYFNSNQFGGPTGIFIDASGNTYVSDAVNHRVQRFPAGSTSATNGVTVAGGNGAGSGANQLNNPEGIYVDVEGNLYVADYYNYRIQKFPPGSTSATNGVTIAGGNGSGDAANQLGLPYGIFVAPNGNVYVSDAYNHRIQKFPARSTSATSGETVAGGNGQGNAANQLNWPTYLYFDQLENVYVSDYNNQRVQKFPAGSNSATNGVTIAGGNGAGSAANQFGALHGIFVDASGNTYVSDPVNHRIQKFPIGSTSTTNGLTVAGGNGQGSTANQLNAPEGVFVSNGNIFVSDFGNKRVIKVSNTFIDTTFVPSIDGVYTANVTTASTCVSNAINIFKIGPSSSVSFQASLNPICPNTPVTFFSDFLNPGDNPTYKWFKNGSIIAGQNKKNYTDSTFLHDNDSVWVVMKSNYQCPLYPALSDTSSKLKIGVAGGCGASLIIEADSVINYFDTLNVKIKVVRADNLFSIFAKLRIDPNRLALIDSRVGDFLGTNIINQPPIVTNGLIDFGMTKTNGQSGTSGNGLVYTFRFKVKNMPNEYQAPFDSIHPTITKTALTLSQPVVNDAIGIQRNVGMPLTDSVGLRYYIPVWPGDLNNDKRVNVADILPIGYFYNSSGNARPNGSLQWRAQYGKLFDDYGVDKTETYSPGYKVFADGNGNGIIDLADQNSIGFNLGKSHARLKPSTEVPIDNKPAANDIPLWVDITDTLIPRAQLPKNITAHINLGTAVNPYSNMYGVAFDLYFDPGYLDVNNITLDYSNSVFGTLNTDYIRIEDKNAASGRISIGLTRYNTSELSGYGNVVDIILPVKLNGPGDFLKVTAAPLSANNKLGVPISLKQGQDSIRVDQLISGIKQSSINTITAVYPNPTSKEINIVIQSKLNASMDLSIFDISGKEVYMNKIVAGKGELQQKVDVSRFAKGMYIIRLTDKEGISGGKFMVE